MKTTYALVFLLTAQMNVSNDFSNYLSKIDFLWQRHFTFGFLLWPGRLPPA